MALPVFKSLMSDYLKDYEISDGEDFFIPDNLILKNIDPDKGIFSNDNESIIEYFTKDQLETLNNLMYIKSKLKETKDLSQINIFTSKEIKELRAAWKFLLTVRAFIHLFNDSKGDTLSIENQLKISKKLSYRDAKKERGVERFMKHLFVNIAKIESLLNTFYSKLPEDLIIKTIYKSKPSRTKILGKQFVVEKGFLNLKNYDSKSFLKHWVSVFETSLNSNLFIHPFFLKMVEEKRKSIKKSINSEQYQSIVEIIASKKNPIHVLRNLNDTKILNELFPEFGRVWGQVQFDIYHHYTTDEHLLLTLHHLSELKKQSFYKEIYSRLSLKTALHVALIFHDIGKKGPKSHSIYGKELTEKIFKRLPLREDDQEMVLWLIENLSLIHISEPTRPY